MGYLRHKALLVNGWDGEKVAAARAEVAALYAEGDTDCSNVSGLVSEVVRHSVNGGASFFIAPDGSKEGWIGSQTGDELMAEAKEIISRHEWVDWCEVLCGGDDDEFAILDSSAASVDTHPKDGDVKQAPLVSGAVGDSRDAQGKQP